MFPRRLPPIGKGGNTSNDDQKKLGFTKHQGFIVDMTLEDIQRNLELQEIEYRRFKMDMYTRMRQFEEIIEDLKYIVRLKRQNDAKKK